jgi:hypothetical protein
MDIKAIIQKESDEKYNGSFRFFKEQNLKKLVSEKGFKHIKSKISEDLHFPISLMVYCFVNDIYKHPTCVCGNKQKFNTAKKEFSKYCSNKCRYENFSDIISVRQQTNLKKYGSTNVLASEYGKKKILETNLSKYGVSNYTKTKEFKEKVKGKSNLTSDGKKMLIEKIKRKHYDSIFTKYTNFIPLFKFEEYDGVKGYKKYPWFCKTCNSNFISSFDNGCAPICDNCKPKGTDLEIFIKKFLDKYKIEYIFRYRKLESGREIDFYIPSKNLGIETSGLYWHSTANKTYSKNDHISKLEECEHQGINLINIFADEIYNKPKIVINRLKSKLSLVKRKIPARKCQVEKISNIQCEHFLKKYHIQGSIKTNIKYGLFYKTRLVAVMTFNKGRLATGNKSINGIFELGRYATIANFNIVGGAGKLLSFFKNQHSPEKIYSYADRRWSNGNLYKKLNFKLDKATIPNYWYVKDFKNRLHRLKFQKNKLKHFLNYDEQKTEEMIMKESKFYKIWDCGSLLFIL